MDSVDSKFVQQLLANPDKEEALKWLGRGGPRHYVGELTHDASVALVQRLYELGAIEVVVVEIRSNAGLASTDTLITTLPNDPPARQSIFKWNNDRVYHMGGDPDMDRGQRHLLVYFD